MSCCRQASKEGEEESASQAIELDDFEEDNAPLFFQPGKTGFYSPRAGKNSDERINCFRNVGR